VLYAVSSIAPKGISDLSQEPVTTALPGSETVVRGSRPCLLSRYVGPSQCLRCQRGHGGWGVGGRG